MDMIVPRRKGNVAPKTFAAVLAAATAGIAMADEPSWPADFNSNVAAHVAATVPSGAQAGSAVCAQQVSVVPSVTVASNGGNVSSWPKGVVLSFR